VLLDCVWFSAPPLDVTPHMSANASSSSTLRWSYRLANRSRCPPSQARFQPPDPILRSMPGSHRSCQSMQAVTGADPATYASRQASHNAVNSSTSSGCRLTAASPANLVTLGSGAPIRTRCGPG
jgi:hypothetical protein